MDYRDLPTETWLNFFDELARMSVFHVTLQGGEPFLREDFSELIHGIVRNRMRFSILSNGTLITDPIAEVIAGTRRCDSVQVSIDGATPQVHDAFRGDGSLVRALEGLRTLQRHGIPVAARTTVHRRNVHELHGIARLLLDDLGLDAFSTNSAGYLGSCRLQAREIVLTLEERQTAMETFLELSREYPGRISASAGPLAEARLWKDMEEARLQGAPPTPGGGALTACGCPWNSLAVRADGMMIPLHHAPGRGAGPDRRVHPERRLAGQSLLEPFSAAVPDSTGNVSVLSRLPLRPLLHRKLSGTGVQPDRKH